MPSFLKKQSTTLLTLVCVSVAAAFIFLLRLNKNSPAPKAEIAIVPPSTPPKAINRYKPNLVVHIISAIVFALLIFAYSKQNNIVNSYENYVGKKEYIFPRSLNEAVLWTFDSKSTLISNSVPIYKHPNNSHGLLVSTDEELTPLYGWGVALAYPDLCQQKKGKPFLLNIVYVVNGKINEIAQVPIVGNSNSFNLSKRLGLITVNVNVNLASNCKFSTVSAELVKK